ncbi:MAG TPA: nucleotidyltransferase family protein, partial [Phycisphaerae bacterium]
MTVREQKLALPLEEIRKFCRHHPSRRLSLFGSILRDEFGEKSDVDFLVELLPGRAVGLFKFIGMQNELEDLIGRKADFRTAQDLHVRFRDKVVAEAE